MNAVKLDELKRNSVGKFLSNSLCHLIGGKWVESTSGKTFKVENPATEEIIAHVAEGNKEDVDLAVKAARQAFEEGEWSRLSSTQRCRLIWKIGELIEKHSEELSLLESLDTGQPWKKYIIDCIAELVQYNAGWASKIEGKNLMTNPQNFMGEITNYHAFTIQEPIGVVGVITAFSAPLTLFAKTLSELLAAGCCAIIKPSEQTPLSNIYLCELISRYELLPPGVINLVNGFEEPAISLSKHPDVNCISFTGSVENGKSINKYATKSLKKVNLELGGKSPNIIFPDCDLSKAIAQSTFAFCFNSGQNCTAGSRLFIHENIFNETIQGIMKVAKSLKVGPPSENSSLIGSLISKKQLRRVLDYIDSAVEEGAEILCGGHQLDQKGYFIEPTIIINTKPNMRVVCEEVFGPVVVAIPFKDTDDIANFANDTKFGLAAGIWTKDFSLALSLAKKIKAGIIWVNGYDIRQPSISGGGLKQSGLGGQSGSFSGIEGFTETKTVCFGI